MSVLIQVEETTDAFVNAIRITPDDIAEIRGNYAQVHLRERRSSFGSVVPRWCSNNRWFRYFRTQARVERETADRVFWGQRIDAELWNYIIVALVPQKFFPEDESGTLQSSWMEQCISEEYVKLNKYSGMQILEDPSPLEEEWNTARRMIRLTYDPQGILTAHEVRGKIRQEHIDYFRVVHDGESHTVIAQESGESQDAVNQRIYRTRLELQLMNEALKANPDVDPADLAFFRYMKELPEAQSTEIIRKGGFYLFFQLNGEQLIPLEAKDGAEAEEALQEHYRNTLRNALNRFPNRTRVRTREILLNAGADLEKAAKELSDELPDFLNKFLEVTEVFDQPR